MAHVFRLPNKYTPYLAEIQFCIHIIILEKALPMMDRDEWVDNFEVNPLEMFLEYREKFLVLGSPYPFDYLHSLLQYGINVGKNIAGQEHVIWSKDGCRMYFDG